MSNELWAVLTLALVLGIPTVLVWRDRRGKIRICADELREAFCEWLTPEEYEDHLEAQRRITASMQRRRCAREMGTEYE